jgi:anaerobic magnesium-protoporphyrin IX monomethyl ester cyclase
MEKVLTKESRISLFEAPATQFGKLMGKPSLNEFTIAIVPSRAIPTLDGILRTDGWINTKQIDPKYHGRNGRVTSNNLRNLFASEAALFSATTATTPATLEAIRLYKNINPNGIAIAGGPDATFRTETWLKDADIVVLNEGEKTLSELMQRLTEDVGELRDIPGIAYKEGDSFVFTEERKRMTSEELSQLPQPFYDELTMAKARIGVIETSRGCPNDCDYCGVTAFNGKRYRNRSPNNVIQGLENINDMGGLVFYTDDNLIGIPRKTEKMLETIIEHGLNKRPGMAQVPVSLGFEKNRRLMELMKEANITSLCIGIESINDEFLKDIGKPYTAKQNMDAIKILKENGFWIHGMMMCGGDRDTKDYLRETREFMKKYLDSMQLFALGPIVGTRFNAQMREEGRILSDDLSLHDGHYVLVRPKKLTPYEAQKEIIDSYQDFYSVENSLRRLGRSPKKRSTLGILAYTALGGGIRKIVNSPQMKAHLEFLKSVS